MLLMRLAPDVRVYHGWRRAGDARRSELSPLRLNFKLSARRKRRKMFGTLTLIKRNGSEGSTMTMDSRETTIGR